MAPQAPQLHPLQVHCGIVYNSAISSHERYMLVKYVDRDEVPSLIEHIYRCNWYNCGALHSLYRCSISRNKLLEDIVYIKASTIFLEMELRIHVVTVLSTLIYCLKNGSSVFGLIGTSINPSFILARRALLIPKLQLRYLLPVRDAHT
ncbi:UNVERIFIED_CONTAM: hypothetical protein Sindi_0967700 [Sesamum indicum]